MEFGASILHLFGRNFRVFTSTKIGQTILMASVVIFSLSSQNRELSDEFIVYSKCNFSRHHHYQRRMLFVEWAYKRTNVRENIFVHNIYHVQHAPPISINDYSNQTKPSHTHTAEWMIKSRKIHNLHWRQSTPIEARIALCQLENEIKWKIPHQFHSANNNQQIRKNDGARSVCAVCVTLATGKICLIEHPNKLWKTHFNDFILPMVVCHNISCSHLKYAYELTDRERSTAIYFHACF